MQVQFTSEIAKNIGYSAIVYGKSGIGKTSMAKVLEKPLILDLEGGVTTLKDDKVPFIAVKLGEIDKAIAFARQSDYKTIIFDSYTHLENMLLAKYASESKSEVPTLQDYGKLNMKLQEVLLKLRDLRFDNKNVMLTALEQLVKVEESDQSFKTYLYPLIMARKGNLIQKLVGDVDVVAHLEMGKEQRFLRLEATNDIFAKSRIHSKSKVLPQDLFNGDIKDEPKTD